MLNAIKLQLDPHTCSLFSIGCFVVSSTNKTDRHDTTEILLTVALNTIKQTTSMWFSVDIYEVNCIQCTGFNIVWIGNFEIHMYNKVSKSLSMDLNGRHMKNTI